MLTWRSDDGSGLEGTRVLLAAGGGFRALGRLVRTGPAAAPFTASYRLIVGDEGAVSRVSVTSATAERERHLTVNHTEDGFWMLDRGSGAARADFDGAVDVDLALSPAFNTLPVRRLGLHREAGEHTVQVVFLSLPDLEVELVEQHYRTVRTLDGTGTAVIGFRSGASEAEIVVDADGFVVSYPGIGQRL
jgi:uncharacterized protein